MKASERLLRLHDLKDGDLVTFTGNTISFQPSVYTIARATDKAIKIDDEWIPKSQIIDCPLVTKNHEVYDDELARSGKYSFRTEKIEVLELQITDWFDKKNNSQRAKGWAY